MAAGAALIAVSPTDADRALGAALLWVGGMLAQAGLMVRAYRLLALERHRRPALRAWLQPRVAVAVAVLVAVTVAVAAEARLDLHQHARTTSNSAHHSRL